MYYVQVCYNTRTVPILTFQFPEHGTKELDVAQVLAYIKANFDMGPVLVSYSTLTWVVPYVLCQKIVEKFLQDSTQPASALPKHVSVMVYYQKGD